MPYRRYAAHRPADPQRYSAVTHVDYSARIQTVRRRDHAPYYDLIHRFEEKTGCGVIVNTSFNVRGEPIVCTPSDAYRCFMRTEMNVLNLGRFLLFKEEQPPWPERTGADPESEDAEEARPPEQVDEFSEKLAKIFRERVIPLSERLRKERQVKVNSTFPHPGSAWEAVDAPLATPDTFEIPAPLLEKNPNPVRSPMRFCLAGPPGPPTPISAICWSTWRF